MNEYYILVGQTPMLCDDEVEFAKHYNIDERRVRLTRVGPYFVSTEFLGVDRNFSGKGPPTLFETTVGIGEESALDSCQFLDINKRCAAWLEAETQHESVVRKIKEVHDDVEQIYPEPLETK